MLPTLKTNIKMPTMPISAVGRPGSNEPFWNRSGQLNASNNKDMMLQFASMMQQVASGKATFDETANAHVDKSLTVAQNYQLTCEAYRDRTSAKWSELGANIGATIYETVTRDGFMRRFLLKADLQQGNDPRIQVRKQNVTAIVASGPAACYPQMVRENYILPPEFYIHANPRIEEKEINRGTSDLLEDVFNRSQENIMVGEDLTYKVQLDATVGIDNELQILAGGVTPSNLATLRQQVSRWGLPVENLLMTNDSWADIVGNAAQFANLFDPVTQYEINQTGYLGTLLGIAITTDGFRDPNQRVLQPNELYMLSSPINHGAYTDRGPVQANPVDDFQRGSPSRGWYLFELLSITVANSRSVVKGLRSV